MIRKRSLGGRIISNTGLRRVRGGERKAGAPAQPPEPKPSPDQRQAAPAWWEHIARSAIGNMH
jgi:hypothetical protein